MHRTTRLRLHLATLVLSTAAFVSAGAPPLAADDAPPDAEQEVTHSWALAPAGAADGTEAGNRVHLSYDLAPGDEIVDSVTLYNFSNVQLTFDLYATDARNNAEGAFDLLPATEAPTGVGSWITVPQGKITVPADSQATFPITIAIPRDVEPGDHAGAILAASRVEGTGGGGKVVTLERRTGSRVYVRVDGPLTPSLQVERVSTRYTSALNPLAGRAEVSYEIVNRGNVRLSGTHRASVAGPFGVMRRSTDTEELPELLPGESMRMTRTITGVAASGIATTEVDVAPHAVAAGVGVGELQPSTRRTTSVAASWTVVAAVVVLALILFAGRRYGRHRARDLRLEHRAA